MAMPNQNTQIGNTGQTYGDAGAYALMPGMAPAMMASGALGGPSSPTQALGMAKSFLFGSPGSSVGNTQSLGDLLSHQASEAAVDPLKSSQIATEQVQSNPILGQLFGKGGSLEQATGEAGDLAKRGFSMKPEDYEAYGQASGNIARQFGQQEAGLAEALSQRGLSASGAANRAFVGSQGNKMEQLAGLQRKIADDRMKTNMERLNQTRNYQLQLGSQGAGAIQNQFGRQQSAEQLGFSELAEKSRQAQDQANMQFMQQQKTKSGGLAGALTKGIYGVAEQAPGMAATAAMA